MSGPQPCFHCGEAVPSGTRLSVDIDGIAQPMCCPGCRAVASLIAGSGMASFYRQRTAFSETPASDAAPTLDEYRLYDDTALRRQFCNPSEDGTESARLLLGGVTCAACTWLIEQTLLRETGILDAQVNLQQQRLMVRFDNTRVQPSRIFALVEALGYSARPFHNSSQREQIELEYRTDLRRVAVAGVGMMQVGMFGIALHAGDLQGIALEHQTLLRSVSLLVASFVMLYSARPFFTTAWRHLRHGSLVMDLPVALAIGLAFSASVWATATGGGEVYFDSVVMFTFFLLLGRFFEKRVRRRHMLACHDAEDSLPLAVTVRRGEAWERVSRRVLQPGDTVRVVAGETIALDGTVHSGTSAVREDTFNGEYVPRTVAPGDAVFAGTINLEGSLELEVQQLYESSRLAALQQSVERAQRAKPNLARMADRLSAWFVAGILLITAVTGLVWSQIAPDQVLWICLSVLVISCPCALALATPAALTTAASALRDKGVVVHGENAIEALSRARLLVFDKTGTLTEGKLQLEYVAPCGPLRAEALTALGSALQQHSNHPVAHAFRDIAPVTSLSDPTYVAGAGVEASWEGQRYRMGSERFCREMAPSLTTPPDASLYWVALCTQDQPLAWFGFSDRLRPETSEVVTAARRAGMTLALLTGDSSSAGNRLAEELGFEHVGTGLSPEDKMQQVRRWQEQGQVVMAVGDGLNDAPLLSLANASFAVASATDLARAQADFVVDSDNLGALITSLHKARQCTRVIKQNFAWALGYNCCGIPLAAMGFIPPWAAALGMSLSSLIVVMNSLRLNKSRG
ncbi:heavy metal translocating P-type ATPase [Haliea sp. E1-2-M8]|uniref:heavy metal translocating P-type ATPase n=1 Tax=Haliea sp. E1-2-M8 TaxID=3064706 RepID=UPI00271FEE40|nr:heavy metal translocating P-type ATPase [Haliea sp. E1-2-M8]MDO8860731.1 heavy metal translocating P-type ATPase [Haliea sp. E1-2-M8]